MERIRQALELARAEREAARAHGSAQPLPEMIPVLVEEVQTAANTGTHRIPPVRTLELEVDGDRLRRSRLLQPDMRGPGAKAFRMLRTQVLQRMKANKWSTLGIVSPTPGTGASTVALNLAMAISLDTLHSSLLVDFNLRNPSLATLLGIPGEPGVEQCLRGEYRLEEVFVRIKGYERMLLAPAAGRSEQSSELLSGAAAYQLVRELRARYADRVVLFDLPAVLSCDDTLSFAPLVDAVLLVISEGQTRVEDMQRCFELLKNRPVIGTVLNRSRDDVGTQYAY